MQKILTLQAYIDNQWKDMAQLYFEAESYRLKKFEYLTNYVLDHFAKEGAEAISINYPVNMFIDNTEKLWTCLGDIAPAGASRRYWIETLDIKQEPESKQNYLLLKKGAISPIGNLRIKEAVPTEQEIRYFELESVKDRQSDFLEYANQSGAMVGGATGAGGEAPKLLLKRENNKVWIDNQQKGDNLEQSYLVKYPRGNYSQIDCDILRAEYHYYNEIQTLGFNTINTELMFLEEGKRYPSLWLPRFDIIQTPEKRERLAVESVYSMLQKSGGMLDHETTIRQLLNIISNTTLSFDRNEFIIEWVKRDLLNIAFGNSDNHGRNTSFLRNEHRIWLSPIYDFAPMRADPEGIIRSITWNKNMKQEFAGSYQFELIAESLADLVNPMLLLSELKSLAANLVNLKNRLLERGVPDSIINYPAIGFDYLPEKLKAWGLV